MSTPFEPKGDNARWRIIYDMLTEREINDVLTYEAMGEALDLDPVKERHPIQMAMRRAAKELEEKNQRAVKVEPNVGYRIVQPIEHLDLAKMHQRKSSRSLVRSKSKVANVDLNGLTIEQRRIFEVALTAVALQLDFNRRLDLRQRRLEQAVEALTVHRERTDDEVADLQKRMAEVEARLMARLEERENP